MAIRDHYPHGNFCWVDLAARDMSEARDFYQRLIGWKAVDIDTQGGPPYAHFQLQELPVAGLGQLEQAMVDRRMPAAWNSYVAVEDLADVCAKVESLGGKVTVQPQRVLDAGSLAFLQDPTGATIGLWQKDQHFGAAAHQDYHCFCWNELCTRDIERAAEFYGQLLGWEFAEYPSRLGKSYIIRNQGEECSGMLQIDHRWGDMRPNWMVYFAVRSVDITVDQVRQLGGWVLVHPFDIEEGRFAVVSDGQGGMFDLVQMRDA